MMNKMNFKLIINICFLIIIFVSCQKSEKYENAITFSFNDFNTIMKLNANTIEFDELIMKPLKFVLSDSLLIVQNIRTENMIYVYNINTKMKVGEYISWGSGPNELQRIKDLQLVDSTLYITDTNLSRINLYDINDFHLLTSITPKHKVQIDDRFYSAAYTNNGYVATTMNPDDKRLVFYNSNGEKEYTISDYPYYGTQLSDFEKMEGFLSSIVVSQKHKRIYLFGMNTDLIEIYDFNGELIKRLHGPEQFFPQIKTASLGDGYFKMAYNDDSRFAFSSPIVIDDEIYVSYSGNSQKENEEISQIKHILVFDKDCNPVRGYELSKSIVSFTIDPIKKHIYATSNIPDFHIVVFKL